MLSVLQVTHPFMRILFGVIALISLSACNLTIDVLGNSGGKVISDDGHIECPGKRCSYNYDNTNNLVTLTAVADSGYHFNGFGNGRECENGIAESFATGICSVHVNTNRYVKAEFVWIDVPCPDPSDTNCLENPKGDYDGDGVINESDKCPVDPTNQCDGPDSDGDTIVDSQDLCPKDASNNCVNNPQGDFDEDGQINGEDPCPSDSSNNCLENGAGDFDGDGVSNAADECPTDSTGSKKKVSAELFNRYNASCDGLLPDFDSLSPTATGKLCAVNLDLVSQGGRPKVLGVTTSTNWAMRIKANFNIATAGSYTFKVNGYLLDTAEVIVNGDVAVPSKCGRGAWNNMGSAINLSAGTQALEVRFTDDGWPDRLVLEYSGPDTNNQMKVMPNSVFN